MTLPFLHVKTVLLIGHSTWFNLKFTCSINTLVILSLGCSCYIQQRVLNKGFEITKWNLKVHSYFNAFTLYKALLKKLKVNIIYLEEISKWKLHLFTLFSRLWKTYESIRNRWSSKDYYTDIVHPSIQLKNFSIFKRMTFQKSTILKMSDLMSMIFKIKTQTQETKLFAREILREN